MGDREGRWPRRRSMNVLRSRRSDALIGGEETAAARVGAADPAGLRGRSPALPVRRDDEDPILPHRSTGGAQDPPASREPELRASERTTAGGTRALCSRLLISELPKISGRVSLASDPLPRRTWGSSGRTTRAQRRHHPRCGHSISRGRLLAEGEQALCAEKAEP